MLMGNATRYGMALGKAPPALLLVAASILSQSCVEYYRAAATPPPQPPPSTAPYAGGAGPQPAPPNVAPVPRPLSATEQLLGPIALYPDPLLALILPASTAPADISAAAAYLVQYGDMTRIDSQPWDPSVRALAHYPAIISWMAENIEWTRAVGSVFLSSPADVMQSIQRLRARALAAGALVSTPQQRVVVQGNTIEILPAESDWVYAPSYDTDVVYSDEPYYGFGGPFMNFGPALEAGPWLSYCFDWSGYSVWYGGWGLWHSPGGWHHPHFDGGRVPPGAHRWHHKPRDPGSPPPEKVLHGDLVPLPRPLVGAPRPPPSHASRSAAPGSAVPALRTGAPPTDRPRLGPAIDLGVKESHAAPPQGTMRDRTYAEAPRSVPAPEGARPAASAPAPHAAPSAAAAPAASYASAPASSSSAGSKNH